MGGKRERHKKGRPQWPGLPRAAAVSKWGRSRMVTAAGPMVLQSRPRLKIAPPAAPRATRQRGGSGRNKFWCERTHGVG